MSYSKSRSAEGAGTEPGIERRLPCRICSKPTLSATLSQYGARCAECFRHYCESAPTAKAQGAIEHSPIGGAMNRDWAHRLRLREQHGERLTKAQRTMWRAALRVDEGDAA